MTDYLRCQWKINEPIIECEKRHIRTLDVLLSKTDDSVPNFGRSEELAGIYAYTDSHGNDEPTPISSDSGSPLNKFLVQCLVVARDVGKAAVKFLIPVNDGYVVKSDFLEQRLEGFELARIVAGFLSPLQAVKACSFEDSNVKDLIRLLASAAGGILLQNSLDDSLQKVESELNNRISFPWLLTDPIPHKRLAIVQERVNIAMTRRRWESAAALGISLVVISSGDWFADDEGPFGNLREAFIAVDITADEGFTERIVKNVRNYPQQIDGVFTTSDLRLVAVAEAAEILGLPTSPVDAYRIATDKHLTRMGEPDADQAFVISSVEDLRQRLATGSPLVYPLVVKPTFGSGSECVFKVCNTTELIDAVSKASARHSTGRVIIEPYVAGPEVDANFVLLNGTILFSEILDDFPCSADADDGSPFANFAESQAVTPSFLPLSEQRMLEASLYQSILRQGFRTGVFHVEARVRNSSMEYSIDSTGTLDLRPRADPPTADPSVFLHEINARPPGYQSSSASLLGYGIDYWALQILCAVGRWSSVESLAIPFVHGPPYHLLLANANMTVSEEMVKATFPGLELLGLKRAMVEERDPMLDLQNGWPELKSVVRQHVAYVKDGEAYGANESAWWWLATILVVSLKGRMDVLKLGEEVARRYLEIVEREDSNYFILRPS